jgi:hypothetical protein
LFFCGSTNKLQVDKLVDGTEYLFRVRAENKSGLGEPLEAEKAIIPKSPFCKLHKYLTIKLQGLKVVSNLFHVKEMLNIFA